MSMMLADATPAVATPPSPAAPPPTTPSTPDVLKAATPAEDVDTVHARAFFGDVSAVAFATTIAPRAQQFDGLIETLETLPLVFVGQDPVTRQQQIEKEREAHIKNLPPSKAVSRNEIDAEIARRKGP